MRTRLCAGLAVTWRTCDDLTLVLMFRMFSQGWIYSGPRSQMARL